MSRNLTILIGNFVLASALFFSSSAVAVDFGREIQPILARHCYECHGEEKQKGKLRLDDRASATLVREGATITPGKAAESELYRRITLPKGHDDIMPNRGEPLSKTEIDLIRDWINEGAVWPDNVVTAQHWSYVKPIRPNLPETKNKTWGKNSIDQFILARLERQNLDPSPEANPAQLLRRVYLDLTGLPPSPEESAKFIADRSPNAYETAVDRLLASEQYGVRWARSWLDLARYADSSGYQRDNLWEIWPYRDWVIDALNADMPFDQFTIEQLAGDLLPNATIKQKIATGFNRCAPINVEAGSDQEESRVNQVFDRVNTLGTVWLGSTVECAQCHNHKYDPISQKEYYQLFAFFNNTPKESRYANPNTTIALDFDGPYLKLPDANIEGQRATIEEKIQKLSSQLDATSEQLLSRQPEWEKKLAGELGSLPRTHVLEMATFESESGSAHRILPDKSVLIRDDDNDAIPERDLYSITVHTALTGITGFKIETLTDASLPGDGPGRGSDKRPNFVLTDFKVSVVAPGKKKAQPIQFKKARASFEQRNFTAAKAIDNDGTSGWAIAPQFSKDHWAIFETASPIGSMEGTTFLFKLAQNSGSARMIGRLRLSAVTGAGNENDIPAEIVTILETASAARTEAEKKRLSNFFLSRQPELEQIKLARTKLNSELKNLQPPKTLAMQELEEPRMSSTFVRGNFLEIGEPVLPDVPAILPPLTEDTRNRLALARWLVSTNNPLVARVTVNRAWMEFFGHGIVTTPEDFGLKGDSPTHPELLDWLAMELMEPTVSKGRGRHSVRAASSPSLPSDGGEGRGEEARSRKISPLLNPLPTPASRGEEEKSTTDAPYHDSMVRPWSMKHIHRLIVTSATYRQSSRVSEQHREVDDQNKLYARGPRYRMDAEMIRDNALFAAGLLSLKMGGAPVYPFQPAGLWESKVGGNAVSYNVSEGEDRYRRGLYTVLKRTSPYPSFISFDAPDRNACVVRRTRSNTPLQALTLLNDPVYVEAAQALAKRVLNEKSKSTLEGKLRHAFELCLARQPREIELKTLTQLYEAQLASSRYDKEATEKLLRNVPKPEGVEAAELAAWFSVASALLNLDEMITKG